MTAFHEYLRTRLETGGFSTEDTLTSFLPLVREVLDAEIQRLENEAMTEEMEERKRIEAMVRKQKAELEEMRKEAKEDR